MTRLEDWLSQGTLRLSADAASRVRTEIFEHYESARDAAIRRGESAEIADRLAVDDLGDPKAANCEFRKVLLTSAEVRILRQGNSEARAICSRGWVKVVALGLPLGAICAAIVLFLTGNKELARELVAVGSGMGILMASPFLPIYTRWRARIFRAAKWAIFCGMFWFAFPHEMWILGTCLWPIAWIEATRMSIRRKLPVAQWPKQLYL
jgi:hypothetical protein